MTIANETKNVTLIRKVDHTNFMVESNESVQFCFSTVENSEVLIAQGEFALVLKKDIRNGIYCIGDIDANRNYGYDEFRVSFTRQELIDGIDYIVVPNEWSDCEMDENADDYNADEDPFTWMENLLDFGHVVSEREFKAKEGDVINFNF